MRAIFSTCGWLLLLEQRQRQRPSLVLARQRDRVFHVDADDVGARIQRLDEAVGPQTRNEQQAAARTNRTVDLAHGDPSESRIVARAHATTATRLWAAMGGASKGERPELDVIPCKAESRVGVQTRAVVMLAFTSIQLPPRGGKEHSTHYADVPAACASPGPAARTAASRAHPASALRNSSRLGAKCRYSGRMAPPIARASAPMLPASSSGRRDPLPAEPVQHRRGASDDLTDEAAIHRAVDHDRIEIEQRRSRRDRQRQRRAGFVQPAVGQRPQRAARAPGRRARPPPARACC